MSEERSCRACFSSDKELIDIFSIYGDVEVSFLLKFCIGIEIKKSSDPFSHVSLFISRFHEPHQKYSLNSSRKFAPSA